MSGLMGWGYMGGVKEWAWGVLDGFGMNEIITETAAKKKKEARQRKGRARRARGNGGVRRGEKKEVTGEEHEEEGRDLGKRTRTR